MQSSSAPVSQRPGGITILGTLAVLIGILGIAGGAILLFSDNPLVLALSAFAVVIGILYLATGVGFFRGDNWARLLGMIVSVLSLARNLVEAATGGIVFAIPGIIVAAIILYYLTRPQVRAWFARSNQRTN